MDRTSLDRRFAGLSPAKRALLEQKLKEKGFDSLSPRTLSRRPTAASAPLSFAQQRLWFLDQYEPNSSVYNLSSALRLRGELSRVALEQSLNEVIHRHEALRTTFSMVAGEPVQIVVPSLKLSLPIVDLTNSSETEKEEEGQRLVGEAARRPFDLTRGPLFRATLVRLGEKDHLLLLSMHHIVSDGWSMGVLYRELSALYDACALGQSSSLSGLPVQYADYAVWQKGWLRGEVLEKQLSFWKKQLEGAPGLLNLPTDHPRPAVQSFRGARQSLELSKELTQGLAVFSRKQGVTLFMTLLAAFQTLLYRYTGQEDIVVGSPIANRNRTELEGLIGFFVNTLLLRSNFSGDPTFRELLHQVRKTALDAYEHQDLPFEKLVEELQPERSLSHSPLFQVMFVLQNVPSTALGFDGVSVTPVKLGGETAKFDLTLSLQEDGQELRGSLHYNTDLFDQATVNRMAGHFQAILESILANPDRSISSLPLLTEGEKRQLLVEWNRTEREYPKDRCIHQLFEAQVEKTPDATAVIFEDQRLTYGELNTRANQLAHYLQRFGVGPDTLVGICVERSLEMVVGLLGVLKAGGAYVPLDPGYPKERLAFMLEDTQTAVVLSQEGGLKNLPDHNARAVCLDRDWEEIAKESTDNPDNRAQPENLAYVIYTSGSTGNPKGVAIKHASSVAFLAWTPALFKATEMAGVLASTSICFDLSVFEIFAPLSCGGRVVLAQNALALSSLPAADQVTLINTVPSAVTELLRMKAIPPSVITINLAGEPLKSGLVKAIYQGTSATRVYDLYGPSEDTTYSTVALRTEEGQETIGKPLPNGRIYILDSAMHPVPLGVAGELYIGGDGLARGYLKRPDLTAEKFIPNPFSSEPGARLYKTGDLARYLADGNIEFLGRRDTQVKLRGYRIELGEVESILNRHPKVREAVVLAREDPAGDKRLVAYLVVNQGPAPTSNDLRGFLKEKLPDYMVPTGFVFLDSLPLTPNGKVDRRALPAPEPRRLQSEASFVGPRTALEKKIAKIWAAVLKLDKVGIHDNFFESGGHSLKATQVMSRLREALQVDLPLRALFESPTVAELAEHITIRRQTQSDTHQDLVKLQSGTRGKHVFCFPYLGGLRSEYVNFSRLAPVLGQEYSFFGLQIQGSNGKSRGAANIEEIAAGFRRAIQNCQPHGPYFLIGECAGGVLAFETARQLQRCGEKIALLALLDTHAWSSAGSLKRRLTARLRYRRTFGSTPWWWDYYGSRTVFHLRALQRIPYSKRLLYLFDKMGKAIATVPLAVHKARSLAAGSRSIAPRGAEARKSSHEKRAERAYFVSLMRYTFRPDYVGRITLLVNERTYASNPSLGWNQVAAGGLDIYKLPGDHDSCVPENILLVAEILKLSLDKAEREIP